MKTNENLKKVALIFFLVLGLAHIISGLMVSNGYFLPISFIINHVLDIPFAMSALIYGFASLHTRLSEEKHKIMQTIFIILTIVIFIAMIYINIFVPDKLLS